MKIISVIITPPKYFASGAITAAEKLSKETSYLCNLDLAIMSNKDLIKKNNNFNKYYFKCRNKLIGLHHILPYSIKNAFWTSNIFNFIKKNKPDLVHFHNPIPPLALWALCKYCLSNKIPYIISSHGFVEMFDFKKSFNINIFKSLFIKPLILNPFYKSIENATALFCLSPNEINMIKEKTNFNKKLYIVPNGYNKDLAQNSNLNNNIKSQLIKRFKLNENIPNFFFLGNHTYNKGVDIILKSLRHIKGEFRIIIGGAIRSKKEYEKLINTSNLLNDETRYLFTNFLTDDEVFALYKISNCFIFPTRADTFPLVILEAMSSELPIISTKVGGIPYQVDETCGILINPDQPKELASAIQKFINNNALFKKMGINSRKKVLKDFSWEESAKKAHEAYKEILKIK